MEQETKQFIRQDREQAPVRTSNPGEVAILGAGSWGTALAVHLAGNGIAVKLWERDAELARQLSITRRNDHYLPGVTIPVSVVVTADLEDALERAMMVVLAVPSQSIRSVVARSRACLRPDSILINTAKGLEDATCLRLSEVICDEAPELAWRTAVISGPSHAEEVGRGMPTAVVAAATTPELARQVQDLFMTVNFRVYTSSDMVGVELGGALKNIIALAAGISEGLGYGDNTKAALLTRGLTEIARLGIALGASPLTFLGLAGVGDLIVTATSKHSRNWKAGFLLGQGGSLADVLEQVGMVVEGVQTIKAARLLAHDRDIEMPITEQIYQVLFSGLAPGAAVSNLMTRSKRHETEDMLGALWAHHLP
jgi:glycerol-3-phosphate dehydrogenase (NAD(P)+)